MRIVSGSGGSLLCPPGHPMLFWHIEDGRASDPNLIAGLDYALKDEYGDVPQHVKDKVQKLYDDATLVESEQWVRQVYGYFKNCYSPDGEERNVSKAVIYTANQMVLSPPEHHLGYLYVRKHFPDHVIRLDLIENPKGYGSKPCIKCGKTLQYESKVDAFAEAITCRRECPEGAFHAVEGVS